MSCVSSYPYQKKKQNQARCQDIPLIQQPETPTDQLDHDFVYHWITLTIFIKTLHVRFKSEG